MSKNPECDHGVNISGISYLVSQNKVLYILILIANFYTLLWGRYDTASILAAIRDYVNRQHLLRFYIWARDVVCSLRLVKQKKRSLQIWRSSANIANILRYYTQSKYILWNHHKKLSYFSILTLMLYLFYNVQSRLDSARPQRHHYRMEPQSKCCSNRRYIDKPSAWPSLWVN